MNGNIVVTSDGGEVNVNCSNHNTIFKDTVGLRNIVFGRAANREEEDKAEFRPRFL